MENYMNKKWLIKEYHILGKSIRQIAREYNVHHTTILYWRDKLGILPPKKKI